MKRKIIGIICCISLLALTFVGLSSCANTKNKIGASFGAGSATRWDQEKAYMEEMAKELNVDIEVRVNRNEAEKTQFDDCKEMIDSGIGVLILMPRNANQVGEIVAYANQKKVKVISYARLIMDCDIDLYIGYDSKTIGQRMAGYLAEYKDSGDYIILRGDDEDSNANLIYEGAQIGLGKIKDDINIILDAEVDGWKPENAKALVLDAIQKNNNRVDAILAPNDAIAGACAEAIAELGITDKVYISGMDAEISAVKRIVAGTQSMTVYLDLRDLARQAVLSANAYIKKESPEVNQDTVNGENNRLVSAYLVPGKIVTKENIDKVLIDTGYCTREQIYG